MKCGLRHWFQLNWEYLGRTFIFRVLPPGGLFPSSTFEGGLNREGGLI